MYRCSVGAGHHVVDRRDGRRAPAVVAPLVQGQVAAARAAGPVPDGGRAVQRVQLGARPPAAPQVHGHGRGPAQLEPRVLLLARGLGADHAAPGVRVQGVVRRHGRHGGRLGGHVAVPAVRAAGRRPVVRAAHRGAVVAVGRGPAGRAPGGRPAAARAHAARHVPDQQRGAHVGTQAVRQVSGHGEKVERHYDRALRGDRENAPRRPGPAAFYRRRPRDAARRRRAAA